MNRNPPRHRRRRRAGFTLVEVLVSLVLMGIVIPVAMRGAALATRASGLARHTAEAATLGEAKLAEMVTQGDWASGGTEGDFPGFPDYRWRLESTERDLGITELRMAVSWKERGEDRAVYVSTFTYVPTGNAPTNSGASTATPSKPKP
jgi:prepilin-type N-terminal cleavage/methylation domain-containing protein